MRSDWLHSLPADLPVPPDDGACRHLTGAVMPAIELPSTAGRPVRLDALGAGWTVIYAYPRTGEPDKEPPGGVVAWNAIPGARGCTPQTCAYRDRHAELLAMGAQVFGLSTQSSKYQREMVSRLHVPFEVLSDADLRLTRALCLPTFEHAGLTLLKRFTLFVRSGRIEHCAYPVFPTDRDAEGAIAWLRGRTPIS